MAMKNRVGRPRVSEREPVTDAREDLLASAGKLFATVGYAAATTKDIAHGAGLRQPSMFHYFGTKAEMLEELLDRIIDPTVELLASVEASEADASVKLYASVYGDATRFLRLPHNLMAVENLPEVRLPHFPGFWQKHAEAVDHYRRVLIAGADAGTLAFEDLELAVKLCWAFMDGVFMWMAPDCPNPERVAALTADAVLSTFVPDRRRLRAIRREAIGLLEELGLTEVAA